MYLNIVSLIYLVSFQEKILNECDFFFCNPGTGQTKATERLIELRQQNPALEKFFNNDEIRKAVRGQVDVIALLIKPVQRLCKVYTTHKKNFFWLWNIKMNSYLIKYRLLIN